MNWDKAYAKVGLYMIGAVSHLTRDISKDKKEKERLVVGADSKPVYLSY